MNKDRIYRYNRKKYFQAAQLRATLFIPLVIFLVLFVHSMLMFTVRYNGLGMNLKQSKVYFFNRISLGMRVPFLRNQPGNQLLENDPKRGTVIAFESPHSQGVGFFHQMFDMPLSFFSLGYIQLDPRKISVKRVLGLPGETLRIKNKEIYINDKLFVPDWKVTFEDHRIFHQKVSIRDNSQDIFVPKGHFFVISDHWNTFNDSRMYGPIPRYKVEGTLIE